MRPSAAIPFLLASAMFAQSPGSNPDLAKENALGALMAQQFRQRHTPLDIPEAKAYVERLAGELAAAQTGDGKCCTVELYAAAEAPSKPTAYPGGYLFVPAKMFFTSTDEDAFVRTLAHAIAHIRLRDWQTMPAAYSSLAQPMLSLAEGDGPENVPLAMQEKFEARERLADEAAEKSVKAVTTGTGEFERIRDQAPLPTPRPTLLP